MRCNTTKVSVGGRSVSVAYLEKVIGNKENSVPVVLCHAITSSKDMLWNTLAESLKAEAQNRDMNIRLVAFDFPGHGDSDALKRYSFDALEEAMVGLLDNLGIEKAHVFGMSMGGVISLIHAARRPERILSLTVQGAPIDGKDFPWFLRFMSHSTLPTRCVLRKIDFNRLCHVQSFEHLKRLLPIALNAPTTMWFSDLNDIFRDRMLTTIGMKDFARASAGVLYDMPGEFMKLNLVDEFESIRRNLRNTPILVVDGARKEHPFIDTLTRLEFALSGPKTRSLCVPNVGHFATILRPDTVASGFIDMIEEAEIRVSSNV